MALLPDFVKDVIVALLIVSTTGIGLFLLGRIVVVRSRLAMVEFHERSVMRRMGCPDAISAEKLYAYLMSLRSASVQGEFLQILRLRRTKLAGALSNPPEKLVDNIRVAEELARLREQWLGLS